MNHSTLISCPSCNHEFAPEQAIEQSIKARLEGEFLLKEKEIEQAVTEKIKQQSDENLQSLQKELMLLQQSSKAELEKREREFLEVQKSIEQATEARIKAEAQASVEALEKELKATSSQLEQLTQEKERLAQAEAELKSREAKITEQEQSVVKQLEAGKQAYEAELRSRMVAEFDKRSKSLEEEKQRIENLYIQQMNQKLDEAGKQSEFIVRELRKQLEDQGNLIEEMKRKHAQGSMQLQGEVAELFLEETLQSYFPTDSIIPVPKGMNGADTIQVVVNDARFECGKIIYESKRTKHFAYEWIDKLKNDMRSSGCDIAVLVTEAMPKELTRFGILDGVWVCSFSELSGVAMVLRQGLLLKGEIMMTQDNKESKIQMLYDYMTGGSFKGSFEKGVEYYSNQKQMLDKEKRVMLRSWAEREKGMDILLQSFTEIYGNIKAIIGSSVPDMKGLEFDETNLIEEKNENDAGQ